MVIQRANLREFIGIYGASIHFVCIAKKPIRTKHSATFYFDVLLKNTTDF